MTRLVLIGLGSSLIFFSTVIEGWALLLETTVTATVSAVEGDSSLKFGDEVTFQWTYDISSVEMNSYCDHGEGVCQTFDTIQHKGFHFLSDATLKFSPCFDEILTKSLSLNTNQYTHKTVVYGGIVDNVTVFRFFHSCEDCCLSIVEYGAKKTMYMAVFQEGKKNREGISIEFKDVKFTTATARKTPSPQLATKLLSSTGILELSGYTQKR